MHAQLRKRYLLDLLHESGVIFPFFFLEEAWQMAAQAALTSTTIRRPSLLAASLAVPGDLRLNVSATGNSTQQQGTHEMRPGAPNFKTIGLEVNQA